MSHLKVITVRSQLPIDFTDYFNDLIRDASGYDPNVGVIEDLRDSVYKLTRVVGSLLVVLNSNGSLTRKEIKSIMDDYYLEEIAKKASPKETDEIPF